MAAVNRSGGTALPSGGAAPASADDAGALIALPFGLLVLLGSFLLFQVELIMARLLLPGFGSSASVWTTCLMFYQGALFAGYLYAARASVRISHGGYRWAHIVFVTLPLAFFPFRIWQPDLPPVASILAALALSAGVPFVALSTTSVVCQAWFTTTRHPRRSDPYFLYGLSNTGALAALLTYPFVIEPSLSLGTQLRLWYAGYFVYALVNVWCVRVLAKHAAPPAAVEETSPPAAPPEKLQRLQWLLLSAGANALLMVVTAVISMDAPVPLIWILPLTLYLVTLIICFAPNAPDEETIRRWNVGGMSLALLFVVLLYAGIRPELAMIGVQNMILFVACLMCHERLLRTRPSDPRALGAFYLEISLGGWVGSVLIGLATPVVFSRLASHLSDFLVAGLLIVAAFGVRDAAAEFARRPLRALAVSGTLLAATALVAVVAGSAVTGSVYGSRTFYGIYHVDDEGELRRLYHGNTVHGVENRAHPGEPLAYYHRDSPIGRYLADSGGAPSAGIVGLGVGALASYRQPDQSWDYYEIDPEVERIARRYFTFMRAEPPAIIGDARLSLQKTPSERYDLLVMDTFSSDFVPLHLITRESVSLYLSKLKPGGVLFFHISNRLFDLDPILARIGKDLGVLQASLRGDVAPEVSKATGRFPSIWYAMTRDDARHEHLIRDLGWSDRSQLAGIEKHALWTDSYVNLFDAMK